MDFEDAGVCWKAPLVFSEEFTFVLASYEILMNVTLWT